MNDYPMVARIVQHGHAMAIGVAALVPLSALILLIFGWHWLVLIAGCVVGAIIYVLLASYVELVRIVWDTLVPK